MYKRTKYLKENFVEFIKKLSKNKINKGLIITLFVFTFISWGVKSVSAEEAQKTVVSMKYENNKLDADLKSATIKEIFEELKKQTGINYEIEKEIQEQQVTILFKDKELTQAIKDILNTIGNPSYMLSYKKNKAEKYEVAGINIRKSGSNEAVAQTSKRELQLGEMEIGLVDATYMKTLGKYRIRAKNAEVNELLERLSSVGGIHDRIIIDRIGKRIDFEDEGSIINLVNHIIDKIRPKIYNVKYNGPDWDENKNMTKAGYIQITQLSDTDIRHRREQAELMNSDGERLLKQGRTQEAIQTFEESSGKDPDYLPSLNRLAEFSFKVGDFFNSIRYYKEIMEIIPDNPNSYLNLAKSYHKNKQIDEALSNYQMYLNISKDENKKTEINKIVSELKSTDSKSYYEFIEKGAEYFRLTKIEEAEKAYKKALEIRPSSIEAHYELMKFYRDTHQKEKAKETADKMAALSPNDANTLWKQASTYMLIGEDIKKIKAVLEKIRDLTDDLGMKKNIENMIMGIEKQGQK